MASQDKLVLDRRFLSAEAVSVLEDVDNLTVELVNNVLDDDEMESIIHRNGICCSVKERPVMAQLIWHYAVTQGVSVEDVPAPAQVPLDLASLQANLTATINGRFDALEARLANFEYEFLGGMSFAEEAYEEDSSDEAAPSTSQEKRPWPEQHGDNKKQRH